MTLIARSCPTCHSIGEPLAVDRTLGSNEPILCRNPWHDQEPEPAGTEHAVTDPMWLLIRPSEDGNPIRVLDAEGLEELLRDPESTHGVTRFLTEWPAERDPAYWADGDGLLLSAKVQVPRPVETVVKWAIGEPT